jgi:hypothetical protein
MIRLGSAGNLTRRDEQFDGLGQLTALAFSPDGLVCAARDCHGAIVV